MTKKLITACGSDVQNDEISIQYNNKMYYFCEKECLDEFLDDPEKFISSDHFLISLSDLQSCED